MNDGNNFDTYENLGEYWLKEDALHSLQYDIYFSLGTRYYCDAGCKVCYIKDKLEQVKPLPIFNNDLDRLDSVWTDFFDRFGELRTNEDVYYLKHNYPKQYEWYKKNAHRFHLCITDNAIFRALRMKELKWAGIADVGVSTDFIAHVGAEKVLTAIKELHELYGVKKIKYVDCGQPEVFADIIKYAESLDLHNCVIHDFRTPHRKLLNHSWAEYQNTWVENTPDGIVQIYRESIQLHYDRFFYSCDDSSNIEVDPFYTFKDEIDINEFLYNLVQKKQAKYKEIQDRPEHKQFRDYYKETQNFIVNPDFNFIPGIMIPPRSRFFYRMIQDGWTNTKYGLFNNMNSSVIPLVERKKDAIQ
jgi:hypothetical protein